MADSELQSLDINAPNAIAGVMGIISIYLGHVAWPHISKLFP